MEKSIVNPMLLYRTDLLAGGLGFDLVQDFEQVEDLTVVVRPKVLDRQGQTGGRLQGVLDYVDPNV